MLFAAGLAAVVLQAAPARAEIYRCVESGENGPVTVFSDLPCDADAQLHHSDGAHLSVIAAAADLDQVAERNREFVESRNRALEQARQRAAREARAAAAQRAAAERLARRYDDDDDVYYPGLAHRFPHPGRRNFAGDARRGGDRAVRDPRVRSRADAAPATDRGTLLSRSGGNRERILQR